MNSRGELGRRDVPDPAYLKMLPKIGRQFCLDVNGIHGAEHWIRVYENGHRLAAVTGANVNVVLWFAILHDSCRVNNWSDRDHGPRAAAFAQRNRKDIDLSDEEFKLLVKALSCHTRGCLPTADITVQTCLDADRLDIGRTGARPMASFLNTDAAKDEVLHGKAWTNRWAKRRR